MDPSQYIEHSLYVGTFLVLVLCGIGLPIPEELTFLIAGMAGRAGGANVWLLCACALLGVLSGDSLTFILGRRLGKRLLSHRLFAYCLSEKNLNRTTDFFRKRGSKTVFIARFLAGLRAPTFFIAGSMGVRYRTFIFWDFLGAMISCPLSIWLAYTFGDEAKHILHEYSLAVGLILGAVVAFMIYRHYRRKPSVPPSPPSSGTPDEIHAVSSQAVNAESNH